MTTFTLHEHPRVSAPLRSVRTQCEQRERYYCEKTKTMPEALTCRHLLNRIKIFNRDDPISTVVRGVGYFAQTFLNYSQLSVKLQ